MIESIALEATTAELTPELASDPYSGDHRAELSRLPCLRDRSYRAAATDTEPVGPDQPDPMIAHCIGPYQITARIGGGIMGQIYHGTQSEECSHPVAIRLVKTRMSPDEIVQRFRSGIGVQAALGRHPNIVALQDFGTDPGHPYLVTDYVDGRPIDEYCDHHRLDVPTRLRLFGDVCRAVHFAHQHAVIHEDLKPGNILVTADGIPKLIGFGIARLIQPVARSDVRPRANSPTPSVWTGGAVLTPEYASPEQVKGEPSTTATDVYALGTILYALLTGRWPYCLKTRDTPEIFQAICEQVPEKPSKSIISYPVERGKLPSSPPSASTPSPSIQPEQQAALQPFSRSKFQTLDEIAVARATTPRRIKRILTGDLDAIVLMGLRKEPEWRYASAEHFAEDIQRYLVGLPVRAHQDSLAYRTAKFLGRNPLKAVAALTLFLFLVGGITLSTTGLILMRREQSRAENSSRIGLLAVNQFFSHVSQERLLAQPWLQPLRKALLEDARRFYANLVNQRGDGRMRPLELALASAHLAKISSLIGSKAEAVFQYEEAAKRWQKLLASQPKNRAYQENLARTFNELGMVLAHSESRAEEALHAFRRAQDLLEPLVAIEPRSASLHHDLALVLLNCAQIERDHGQVEKAITSLQRSLAIESELLVHDPNSLESQITAARAYGNMAQILVNQPDGLEPASAAYQNAVDLLQSVTNARPELADQSCELAALLGNLATCQALEGKLDSALSTASTGVAILERLDRQHSGLLNYQQGIGSAYNMMSNLHRLRREPADSLAFAEKARTLLDRLVSKHPTDLTARRELAKSHTSIGRILQQMGEPVESLRSFQRAVDLYESMADRDPHDDYNLASNLSLCIPLIGTKNGSQGSLDTLNLSKGDKRHRDVYSDRATEVLRRAIRGGFHHAESLRSDTDLDPIRDRPDFQSLLRNVERSQANHKQR
jgi:serine/threonine protein kinase